MMMRMPGSRIASCALKPVFDMKVSSTVLPPDVPNALTVVLAESSVVTELTTEPPKEPRAPFTMSCTAVPAFWLLPYEYSRATEMKVAD